MRLATITLQGFKSFADRTTLDFTEEVSAIVGPNGSGKSNVIDALRWVTGGGRASEFRAGDKRELIFHGSASKKRVGFAEVSLLLEHEGRTLEISRTLSHDGEATLRLGGRVARFLDLEDALAGSGLGRSALAVVGQGEVSRVLMADPARLLAYLAESVGVSRLMSRRESTLSSLAQAAGHLERLSDIEQELAARIAVLAQEAAQAARTAACNRELLKLRFSLAARREEEVAGELAKVQEAQALTQARLVEGREALAACEAQRKAARTAREGAEASYREFMARLEAQRGDVRVAEAELLRGRERCEALGREGAQLAADVTRLIALTQPREPEGDEAQLKAQLAAAEALGLERQQLLHRLQAELQQAQEALRQAQREQQAYQAALASYASSKEGLLQQKASLEARLGGLSTTALAPLETRLSDKQEQEAKAQKALETAQQALQQQQQELADLYAEAQAALQHAKRLRAAFDSRSGYAQGPKNALTSGIAGVIGSVADLLQVPPEFSKAVSSALGRRSEHVVVETSDVAQAVLAHVRQTGGWVTLLPLDLLRARAPQLDALLLQEGGVLAAAHEVVRSEPRFRPVVWQLLGNTLLLQDLEQGVALAKRYAQRPRLVTLSGDVLESYGAVSGGRQQGSVLPLGLGPELKKAEALAHELAAARQEKQTALTNAQGALKGLRSTLEGAKAARLEAAGAHARAREEVAAARSLAAEWQQQHAEVQKALANLQAPEAAEGVAVAPLETKVQALQRALQEAQEALATQQQAKAEAARGLELYQTRRAHYVEARAQFEAAQRQLEVLRERQETLSAARTAAEDAQDVAAAKLEEARARLPAASTEEEAALEAAKAREAEAEARLGAAAQQQAALAAETEQHNLTAARRETALEQLTLEVKAFPAGVERLEGSARKLREAISAAEAELEAIGPVNYRAQQEHQAQSARLADLSAQLSQARAAVAELQQVLSGLDDEVKTRLAEGAKNLNQKFAYYAEELFGSSAEAGVALQWEDARPVGLTLSLRPPQKQTRALTLLSVGERTMGALAFLFALMSAGEGAGLPLAILDEVDAPLDEANIRRFTRFVTQLSQKGTQFVVITHQKATMEVAHALWGVTTEGGASRVFSIRKQDAAPSAQA